MFQATSRSGLAFAVGLLLSFSGASLQAAALPAVGALQASGAVFVGEGAVPGGHSTLYSGDRLRTGEGQATVSFRGAGLLNLSRQSEALFSSSSTGPSVRLERGGLSFTFFDQPLIQLQTEELVFSSVGSFPSLGEVALAGDGSIVLAVREGTVAVAHLRPQPVLVKAGQQIIISPRTAQAQSIGTGAHGKTTLGEKLRTFRIGPLSHTASVVALGGILGGVTAVAIAVPASMNPAPVSPSAP